MAAATRSCGLGDRRARLVALSDSFVGSTQEKARPDGSGVRGVRQAPVVRQGQPLAPPHEAPLEPEHPAGPRRGRRHPQAGGRLHRLHQGGQGRQGRSTRRARPPAPMQGVIKSYDPGHRRRCHPGDTDLTSTTWPPAPSVGSVFRMLRQGQRVVFDLDRRAATSLRLGSEVDMGTPGFPRLEHGHDGRRRTAGSTSGDDDRQRPPTQQLKDWVDEWAAVLQPDRRRLVRRLRRGVRPARASCSSTAARSSALNDAKRPEQLPRPLRPRRRRPRRGPHLHLLRATRPTPAPPTTGGPRPR